MEITTTRPTTKGASELFTGDVEIDAIVNGTDPSRVRVNAVRFSPGARSAWHSHTLGQTLLVTEGAGLVQRRGEPIIEIHTGDVVATPADEEHWHGAGPTQFMTHLSITEGTGGRAVSETIWGAHVTDEQYLDTARSCADLPTTPLSRDDRSERDER